MSENNIFYTSENEKIRLSTFGHDNISEKNSLIFVHGFKGFKDWGFGPYVGRYFAQRGYFVIMFNFSHNGVGESLTEFDELDRFAANTFSREIKELSELIDALKNGYFGEVGQNKIGLIGHSRGGAISLLTAYKNPEVAAVAAWSSVAKLDRYSDRQKEEWKKNGYFGVMNMRTKQEMRLNVTLLEDIENNKDDLLNLTQAVSGLDKPLLIAHGEQDLAVPMKEAEQLYEWSDKEKTELFKLKKTGHTFDIKHPFEGTTDKFEKLLEKTDEFFRVNFSS